MSESVYQRKLINQYEAEGWYVVRLITTTTNGIPDLLCLHPNRVPMFVEVKAKNGKVSPLQRYRHKELESKGFKVLVEYEPK